LATDTLLALTNGLSTDLGFAVYRWNKINDSAFATHINQWLVVPPDYLTLRSLFTVKRVKMPENQLDMH
jgi:hypothetical protein